MEIGSVDVSAGALFRSAPIFAVPSCALAARKNCVESMAEWPQYGPAFCRLKRQCAEGAGTRIEAAGIERTDR